MELCPQCNGERVMGENFCDNCGHKYASNAGSPDLQQAPPPPPQQQAPPPPPPPPPPPQQQAPDPQQQAPDPQQQAPDPQQQAPDPQQQAPDPQQQAPDPQQQAPDPQQQAPDPQQQAPDPQQQAPDPQQQAPDPQQQAPDPQQQAPDPQQQAPDPQQPAPASTSGRLSVLDASGSEALSIPFDDTPKTIGRQDVANFLTLQGKDPLQVSRQQCTVFRENSNYYIEDGITSVQDKPSANHTTVNGTDITGKGKTMLADNDKVVLATLVTATFRLD